MKKIMLGLVMFFLTIALIGCSEKTKNVEIVYGNLSSGASYEVVNKVETVESGESLLDALANCKATLKGHTFKGWSLDKENLLTSSDKAAEDKVTIYPLFEANTYTVTYKVEGEEDIVQSYKYQEEIVKPADPVKDHGTFKGWNPALPKTMPDENLVVTAVFDTAELFTITYLVDGEEYISMKFAYNETITPPENPEKEGYTFRGWDPKIPAKMPNNDLVINATFQANRYSITYKAEGRNDTVEYYYFGDEVKEPFTPQRNFYVFNGWDQEVPKTMPAKNLVFNAVYTEWETAKEANGKNLIFIGHAGCYLGIMNTEVAFLNAAKVKGYKAIECDVKQTKDGVFVVCHDNSFAGLDLASTNWDDLKDVETTVTRGGIKYTSKICTLDRYLQICLQNNCYPVIELKSSKGITNSDTSRMDELMEVIKKRKMEDYVIFLGSQYGCLEWVRNNGYSQIPCQYLVNSCDSQTVLDRCIKWNFDVSFNIEYTNTQEWIDKYHAAGLKVSCYTFSQYTTAYDLQKYIDMNVDFVTCDVLTEKDVKIPER